MNRLHQLSLVILAIAFIVQLSSPAMAQKDKEIRKSLQAGVTQTIGADTEITFYYDLTWTQIGLYKETAGI